MSITFKGTKTSHELKTKYGNKLKKMDNYDVPDSETIYENNEYEAVSRPISNDRFLQFVES